MRNLDEININLDGEPVDRAAPSGAALAAFEQQFDVRLPSEYVQFLRHSNGGHPELDFIEPGYAVDMFYHIDDDFAGSEHVAMETLQMRAYLGSKQINIANDGMGNFYKLDLSQDPPPVSIVLRDEGGVEIKLADSFGEFIDLLELGPQD